MRKETGWRVHVTLGTLLCSLSLSPAIVTAAPVVGTNGNDILFFQGASQAVSTTLLNPYSPFSVNVNGTFEVNTATYYDGLSGVDALFMTNLDDYLALDQGGAQAVFNLELFIAGDGIDIVNMASLNLALGNLIFDGGRANDVLWGNTGADTIRGFDGDDNIHGGPGNDILQGQSGNDTLHGGTGNTTIDGGVGSDTAVFDKFLSEYSITQSGTPGSLTVLDLISGDTHTLTEIESLMFAGALYDSSLTPVPVPAAAILFPTGLSLLAVVFRRMQKNDS